MVDNQHQKISGYRDLSEEEIALMNEIKQKGNELDELLRRVDERLRLQHHSIFEEPTDLDERERLRRAEPHRWFAMARTDLPIGIMKLVRAIAQPGGF